MMSFRARCRQTDMTVAELQDERAFAARGGTPPRRAARALLPDARLLRGSRGPHAGDVPARVAQRETYAQRASLRAWLYRIATNACLDALEQRPEDARAERRDHVAAAVPRRRGRGAVDEDVFARETVELAFMVAIQHLAPRPRAVLILRDVLGWRARDCAELLETTEAGINSALQRARAGLKEHLPKERGEWTAEGSARGARAARPLHGALRGGRRARRSRCSCTRTRASRCRPSPRCTSAARRSSTAGPKAVRHPSEFGRSSGAPSTARTASRRSRTTCATPGSDEYGWRRSTCSGSRTG